jgi:LacI family transcriptional regulator
MTPPKLKDLAEALGLSVATVSRALRNSYDIGEATKNRVKEYAAQVNYRPNIAAQSLRNNRSRSIGVLLPNISNNFFSEILNGIESVGNEKSYQVVITQTTESVQNELRHLDNLLSRSVDGMLISLSSETVNLAPLKKIHETGIPIVFFDRVAKGFDTHTVRADNLTGAFDLTTHLINNGFKNIAQITSASLLSTTQERLEGYLQALLAYGMEPKEEYIQYCAHGGMLIEEIEEAVDKLLTLPLRPDAIIASSDRLTLGTFSILHKKGLKIPDQIALAGYSNFSAPELFNPSLTTLKQPAFEMGYMAATLLINLIEAKRKPSHFEKIVLPTQLTVRNSTSKKYTLLS